MHFSELKFANQLDFLSMDQLVEITPITSNVLELVEHRQLRRNREAHCVVGRLLPEDGEVRRLV